MDVKEIVKCLAALAHQSRFLIFRALVQAGSTGVTPGVLIDQLGIAPATLSFHLKELVNAGLVEGRNESRYIIYSTKYEVLDETIAFLTENCCQKDPARAKTPKKVCGTKC